MQVTVTYYKEERKTSKTGKTYFARSLKTQEHGEEWINGVGFEFNGKYQPLTWMPGEVVNVEIYEEEYNGKMSKKFKPMSKTEAKLEELERRMTILEQQLRGKPQSAPATATKDPLPPLPWEADGSINEKYVDPR